MTNTYRPKGSHLPECVPTNVAAQVLNRAPQTLRKWASLENGPIRPIRINGRLAWRVDELRALLDGEASLRENLHGGQHA